MPTQRMYGSLTSYGATDNRADRWYPDRIDSSTLDRRGEGHPTKREPVEFLTDWLIAQAMG